MAKHRTRKTKTDAEARAIGNANLQPFQKGVSGNPGGRPKMKPFTDAMMRAITEKVPETWKPMLPMLGVSGELAGDITVAEVLVRSLLRESFVGRNRVRAVREVMDRVEGRVPLPLIGSNDGPIEIQILSHVPRPDRRPNKK